MKSFFLYAAVLAAVTSAAEFPTLPYAFPYDATTPQKFEISVDARLINETLLKVDLFRPSTALKDWPDWQDGPPTALINDYKTYWSKSYDWFSIQTQLNKNFSHYATTVPGSRNYTHPIPLHFIHEPSPAPDAIPLLLIHGWPSTSLEWQHVIHPLAHPPKTRSSSPSPSFHVVAVDLPGYGFSPAPTHPGLGPREMGDAFAALMTQLGYAEFGVQSTDLGWFVGMWMAQDHAASLVGHGTDFWAQGPNASTTARYEANLTSPEENAYIEGGHAFQKENAGYMGIHNTRTLQLAYALNDSPLGFLAWMLQLVVINSDGFVYEMEEIVTRALTLWLPGVYGNVRSYKETFYPQNAFFNLPVPSVPTAVTSWANGGNPFPEIKYFQKVPLSWAQQTSNVTFFRQHERCGHFPAETCPEAWMADVREFFGRHV